MNAAPIPPTAGTSGGSGATGTPRTLERDVKIGAVIIVSILLTTLLWRIAADLTSVYGDTLKDLRFPLFLVGIILIWAGAASIIGKIIGQSFRNVVFDRRNLRVGQWVLVGTAVVMTANRFIHSPLVSGNVRAEIKAYAVPIALVFIALLLRILQKGFWSGNESRVTSGEGKGSRRFSLGAAVWTLVGLALAALLGLLAWHEFEFGLSNAPERMALRGYAPRESVASALAAAAPALPEIHTVIAPPLGANGETNWSVPLHAFVGYPYLASSVATAAESQMVRKRVDGIVYLFDQRVPTNGHVFEYCSLLTNAPIKVKVRGVSEAEKKMSN